MEDEHGMMQISVANLAVVFGTLLLPSHFHRYVLCFASHRTVCAAMSFGLCFCCLLISTQILYLYTLLLIFHGFRKKHLNPLKHSCLALRSERVFQGL